MPACRHINQECQSCRRLVLERHIGSDVFIVLLGLHALDLADHFVGAAIGECAVADLVVVALQEDNVLLEHPHVAQTVWVTHTLKQNERARKKSYFCYLSSVRRE